MRGLSKSMDHRIMMEEISRIVDGKWGDGGMWECCEMEGNHNQWLHTLNWILKLFI